MTFNALIVVLGLIAVLFSIAAIRRIRRRHVIGGLLRGLIALTLFLIAGCALLIAANLRTYQRLMADGALYEVKVSQSGLIARPLNQAARAAVGNWQRTP